MKRRRHGRSLQMFQLELKDPDETEALISENLTCPQTGIIIKGLFSSSNFGPAAL